MLTQDEKLAFLKAVTKQISPRMKELEGDMKLELQDLYESDGIDRKALKINGEKVGEISLSYNKPKPIIEPGKEAEALEYLTELGLTEIKPITGWEQHFSQAGTAVIHSETAEIASGLIWQGATPKSPAIRGCEPKNVFPALQNRLDGSLASLLEGGFDE